MMLDQWILDNAESEAFTPPEDFGAFTSVIPLRYIDEDVEFVFDYHGPFVIDLMDEPYLLDDWSVDENSLMLEWVPHSQERELE